MTEPLTKQGEKLQIVPDFLKTFVLTIVKSFYGVEHFVIADYIQRNVCVKEEKLREFLKFDPKTLKPILVSLKVDKIVKERIVTEEIVGRQRKIPYYFINYKGAINVTKYKLDQIRTKLEAQEQNFVNRATFHCSNCSRQYDQMDVGQLMQPDGKLICWSCFHEVQDEENAGPSEDMRSSLAKFNEQTGPLVSIMQQMNGVIFAEHILEPPVPTNADEADKDKKDEKKVLQLGERFFNPNEPKFTADNMKLNLGGDEIDFGEPEKEAVPWLTGSVRVSVADVERKAAAKKSRDVKKSAARLNKFGYDEDDEQEEIELLLEKEKEFKKKDGKLDIKRLTFDDLIGQIAEMGLNGFDDAGPLAKRPRFTLGDDEEDEKPRKPLLKKHKNLKQTLREELTVQYGDVHVPVNEVTEEMLEKMSKAELEKVFEAREKLIDLLFRSGW